MTNNVSACVVVSDLHCGCRFGLCPPGELVLDGGGKYKQSDLQRVTWRWWREFWDEWVPRVIGHRKACVVVNGDIIDGIHHNTVTQISHNLADQLNIATSVLSPIVKRFRKRVYLIRGTEAHCGKSGQEDLKLAGMLGIQPAQFELWLRLSGKLIHFAHHVGFASTLQTEPSALIRELASTLLDAARWRIGRIPDVIVRSHRHTNADIRVQTARGPSVVFCTAGWQLKTPYSYKLSLAKTSVPQIGGSVIVVDGEDIIVRHYVNVLTRSKVTVVQ